MGQQALKKPDPYAPYKLEKPSVCFFTRINGLRATWEISNGCTLGCLGCCQGHLARGKSASLGRPMYDKIMDKLAGLSTMAAYVSGGEPFLNPDAGDILDGLKARGIYISIATNGLQLDEQWVAELANKRIDKILVSIDHYEPRLHDMFRNCEGAWKKSMDGVERASRRGLFVRLGASIWRQLNRYDDLRKYVNMAVEHGAGEVCFNWLVRVGNAKSNEEIFPVRSLEEISSDIRLVRDTYRDVILVSHRAFTTLPADAEGCHGGESFLHLNFNGTISPCSWVAKSELREMFPHVSITDVRDIGHLGEIFGGFRAAIRKYEETLGPFCPIFNYTTSGRYWAGTEV